MSIICLLMSKTVDIGLFQTRNFFKICAKIKIKFKNYSKISPFLSKFKLKIKADFLTVKNKKIKVAV